MTKTPTRGQPDWPTHRDDAPPPPDPRSLRRGAMAALGLMLVVVAVAIAGPWSGRTASLLVLIGWIVAVGFGAWAYRGASPRVVGTTRLLLALGLVAMAGVLALILISFQVRDILAGTVIFGTAGSGCDIEAQAEDFGPGTPVYAVAHASRAIEAGEVVAVTVHAGGELESEDRQSSTQGFDCLGWRLQPESMGRYEVTVTVADEVLASGAFEVAPDNG